MAPDLSGVWLALPLPECIASALTGGYIKAYSA